MDASTVTSKGQVTIPQEIRRALGIRQGSRVAFVAKNGKAELRVLHRAPAAVVSGFGMLGARGRQVPADFDAASLLVPKLAPKLAPRRVLKQAPKQALKPAPKQAPKQAPKRAGRS